MLAMWGLNLGLFDFFFVVVIDKWTKPVDETKLIHDPALLPSVL